MILNFEAVNLMSQSLSRHSFQFSFISPLPLYGIQFLVSIVRKDMMMLMVMMMMMMMMMIIII